MQVSGKACVWRATFALQLAVCRQRNSFADSRQNSADCAHRSAHAQRKRQTTERNCFAWLCFVKLRLFAAAIARAAICRQICVASFFLVIKIAQKVAIAASFDCLQTRRANKAAKTNSAQVLFLRFDACFSRAKLKSKATNKLSEERSELNCDFFFLDLFAVCCATKRCDAKVALFGGKLRV